jgi:hypothetical protein
MCYVLGDIVQAGKILHTRDMAKGGVAKYVLRMKISVKQCHY